MQKINYDNYKKPTDFIKFEQGDNKIRILSDGLLARFHGTRMGGRYVPLGLCTENGDCPHCRGNNEPKRVWRWVAFDYQNKEVKLLDAGPMIGNQICMLGGDPQEYDIIVNKVGEKLKTKYETRKAPESVAITEEKMNRLKPMVNFLIKKYFQPTQPR